MVSHHLLFSLVGLLGLCCSVCQWFLGICFFIDWAKLFAVPLIVLPSFIKFKRACFSLVYSSLLFLLIYSLKQQLHR